MFQIVVNGVHFCEYRHRIEKRHVNTLTVEGGVQVNSIRFEGGDGHGGGHHGHHGHHHHGGHHHAGAGVGFIGKLVEGAIKHVWVLMWLKRVANDITIRYLIARFKGFPIYNVSNDVAKL